MTKRLDFPQLREQAVALRQACRSRREIKQILGIGSNQTLNEVLRGEPPQPWTWRPRAKDDLRARARELRAQGLSYNEIVAQLGVAKSSISHWVSDMPRPERLSYEESCRRQAEAVAQYWAEERPLREAARDSVRAEAEAEIGMLSEREMLIAGAVAYWCEGAKNKPYRRNDRVEFINSDPKMIGFFLRFLDFAGVARSRLIFRVHIHESADVPAAERFWLGLTGADPGQFRRTQLKRHNPTTVRKNTGDTYYGCLRIDVSRSAELYRRIEGWALGTMTCSDPMPTAAGPSD